jgi:hypothetical protein
MVQNNRPLSQGPFLGVPPGGATSEEPDGCTYDGVNALRDLQSKTHQPPVESGDWQVERGPTYAHGGNANVHNIANRTSRRHG